MTSVAFVLRSGNSIDLAVGSRAQIPVTRLESRVIRMAGRGALNGPSPRSQAASRAVVHSQTARFAS
jgi:hypothetical protein